VEPVEHLQRHGGWSPGLVNQKHLLFGPNPVAILLDESALKNLLQGTKVFEQCPREAPSCFGTEIRFDILAAHDSKMRDGGMAG